MLEMAPEAFIKTLRFSQFMITSTTTQTTFSRWCVLWMPINPIKTY